MKVMRQYFTNFPGDDAGSDVHSCQLQVTMQLCFLVLATAAALSQSTLAQEATTEGYNAAGITSFNYPKQISKDQKEVIKNVVQALGGTDISAPKLDSNPNPPDEPPIIKVPDTVSAEWHNIARPAEAKCAVSAYQFFSAASCSPCLLLTAAELPVRARQTCRLLVYMHARALLANCWPWFVHS